MVEARNNDWPTRRSGWPPVDDLGPRLVRSPLRRTRSLEDVHLFGSVTRGCRVCELDALPFTAEGLDFKCLDRVLSSIESGDYSRLSPQEGDRLRNRLGALDINYFLRHVKGEFLMRSNAYNTLMERAKQHAKVLYSMDRWVQHVLKIKALASLPDRTRLMVWGVAWNQASHDAARGRINHPITPPQGLHVSRVGWGKLGSVGVSHMVARLSVGWKHPKCVGSITFSYDVQIAWLKGQNAIFFHKNTIGWIRFALR